MYDLAETRRQNRPEDPHVILAIDDLAACLGDLGEEDFRRLLGLMRHGPRSFIWPIVTLSAEDSHLIHPRMLEALRTRLIGFIHDDERAAALSQDESLDARLIHEGIQFYVPYDEGWLPFWICDPIVKRMEGPTPQEQRAEKQASPSQPPVKNEAKELLISWNERLQTTTAEVREEQRPPHSPLSPSPERIFPETRKLDDDKPALDNPRPWKRPVPRPTDPPENDVPPPAFLEKLPATDSGDENRQNADLLETGEINDRNSDQGNAAENRTTEGSAAKDPEPERGPKLAVPDEVVYETEYDYIDEYVETTTQIDQPGDV